MPINAGIARLTNQSEEEEETIPIVILSVNVPKFSKYNSIKYSDIDPLIPSSASVIVGIAVIIKNIRDMIISPCKRGISTENIMSSK